MFDEIQVIPKRFLATSLKDSDRLSKGIVHYKMSPYLSKQIMNDNDQMVFRSHKDKKSDFKELRSSLKGLHDLKYLDLSLW